MINPFLVLTTNSKESRVTIRILLEKINWNINLTWVSDNGININYTIFSSFSKFL